MSRKTRRGRNTHHLADIGLPKPPPKRCGKCAYCKGLKRCQDIPGLGKTKELAAVFTLQNEVSAIQFRRLSEFSDATCIDMGGLLITFFPMWVADGMVLPILDEVGKILEIDTYAMINGCG